MPPLAKSPAATVPASTKFSLVVSTVAFIVLLDGA
jgi:hypothetical protein